MQRHCVPFVDIFQRMLLHFQKPWTLKLKRQLMFAIFAVVNHLNRPLRSWFWSVIGRFRSFVCFCVSRFIACDRNIMIDGCEKCNYEGSFWTLEFKCLWKVQLEHNQSKWPLGGRQLYGLQESYPFWESWEKSLGSWNTKGDTASHPDFMGGSSPTDWERVIGSPKNVFVEG